MTSPVDTSVKYFHSAMPGAPVLSGTAGSLIAILDACLVDGFGLKTADSLVVSNNVATLNIASGHSAEVDVVVLVSGATPAALNGEQKVTVTSGTAISFATSGIADQSATGTITVKLAPANWAKTFSGTNLAAYKSTDIAASGCLLRVNDTATQNARVVGYESMSDINTGTGRFPTELQNSGGCWWTKSYYTNNTARGWILVADGRGFYFSREHYPSPTGAEITCFGDIASTKAGDAYGCILSGLGSDYSSSDASSYDNLGFSGANASALYMPRSYTGIGGSIKMRKSFATLTGGDYNFWSGNAPNGPWFPNASDGGLYLSQWLFSEDSSRVFRGMAPGFYGCPQKTAGFAARDKMRGVASLPGRTLLAVLNYSATPSFIDITGPWSR